MSTAPPSHAWKIGEIGDDHGRVRLRSGVYGVYVEREDHAMCFEQIDHEAPVEHCTCGFSAVVRPDSLILHARPPYSHLWEVELGGRVLRERDGLRAELQTVRRVHLNPHCYRCQRLAAVVCTDPMRDPNATTPKLSDALLASCPECVTDQSWPIEEVADMLGLDVAWAHPAHALVLLGLTYYH